MKNILKISLSIVIGLVVGCVVTGLLMNRFHRQHLAELYSMELVGSALNAQLIGEGEAELVSKTYENTFPVQVLAISSDSELRNARMADLALSSVKRFYVCTKTEMPKEIVGILDTVSLMPCGPSLQ